MDLKNLCLNLERELLPHLLPAQVSHIQSFGDAMPALQRRLSSLTGRLLALRHMDGRQKLDRDNAGRSYFFETRIPIAFSHPVNACFFATSATLDGVASLAIDAERPDNLEYSAICAFFSRTIPGLKNFYPLTTHLLAKLWLIFECAYKLIAEKNLFVDFSTKLLEDLSQDDNRGIYLPTIGLHGQYLEDNGYLVCIASPKKLPNITYCEWQAPFRMLS